ncbi:armadillo-type protein [Thamnidium elegans]|nr:armadillo-type protein [Thamnidium elegans]
MTTAALSAYHITSEPCQQFRQYGHCTTKDTCTYSHITESVPSLRYSNSTSTCNTQQERKSDASDASASAAATNNNNKFAGLQLIEFQDKLFELCKDQHGCRFLQLKLEESKLNVDMIYKEINLHFVELMTDPFGNYLCQKLLERCDDAQRSSIVQVIAPEFLKICLSMHGTRAVQKLIEFLSTKRQIQAVIVALEPNVVALIKDLNGNHVIQKCLHKLSPEHNQFIYDTVSRHCIEVASHKHGCCVYQRCIDHATPTQKTQLVNVITQHALPLVQDPFGNYVVQYVLELGDAKYSDNLIRRFIDPIRELSVQKFSSNVIEKCIRVAERDTKRLLIAGITNHPQMEKFLRDSYANYVIQTCLDFAEQDQRVQFIDRIRPLLPSIRNTPYGKRIYSKIHNSVRR